MTKDEALRLALDALEMYELETNSEFQRKAITAIKKALAQPKQEFVIDGDTSDGYHTFNELYEFRKAYNVALFNEWAAANKCSVHKSWRHHDGEKCFGGGWFIVVAITHNGQISNHYEAKDWDLFKVPEVEKAVFEFDGHTGLDVINRLKAYTALAQPEREILGNVDYIPCCTDQTCPKCKPPQSEPEPVAFPRQTGDSTWIIDTAFIWRVKHTIDPDTPYDWTPSEEQIETVLLALEKIPSLLYLHPKE